MSIAATYLSAASFTVTGDMTAAFMQGIACRLDCGADGVKYGYADYSSYSSGTGLTTVTLNSSESEAVTSNLASVQIGVVSSRMVGGNTPLDLALLLRGHRSGVEVTYCDTSNVHVKSGSLHINDGTNNRLFTVPSQLTVSVGGLSASTWYAVYAQPPPSGSVLTTSEITHNATMPTEVAAKLGWYHPTNANQRCIGFFFSNASSQVAKFYLHSRRHQYAIPVVNQAWGDGNCNTTLTVTLSVPLGSIYVALLPRVTRYSTNNGSGYIRNTEDAGNGFLIGYVDAAGAAQGRSFDLMCSASKQVTCVSTVRLSMEVITTGFILPDNF